MSTLESLPQLQLPPVGKIVNGPGDPRPEKWFGPIHNPTRHLKPSARQEYLAQARENWPSVAQSPVLADWVAGHIEDLNKDLNKRKYRRDVRDAQLIAAVLRGDAQIVVPHVWRRPWIDNDKKLKTTEERQEYKDKLTNVLKNIAAQGFVGYQRLRLSQGSLALDKELSKAKSVVNDLRDFAPKATTGVALATAWLPLPTTIPLLGLSRYLRKTLAATTVLSEGEWMKTDNGIDDFKRARKGLDGFTHSSFIQRRRNHLAPQIEIVEHKKGLFGKEKDVTTRYRLSVKRGGKEKNAARMAALYVALQTPGELMQNTKQIVYYDALRAQVNQVKQVGRRGK